MIRKRDLATVLIIVVLVALFTTPEISALQDVPTTFGAHRGSSVLYPENTMEAFELALGDDRYRFIEFDIQYTKDEKIVVFHDRLLWRLAQQDIRVNEVTFEELQAVVPWKIPLYHEVMDLTAGKKQLNIEFKLPKGAENYEQLVDFVIEDCRKRGVLDDTIFSAVATEIVVYISETYPELPVGKIHWVLPSTWIHVDALTEAVYDDAQEMGADYLMLHGANIWNYESLVRLKPDDMTLVFWYFDDQMYIVHSESDL